MDESRYGHLRWLLRFGAAFMAKQLPLRYSNYGAVLRIKLSQLYVSDGSERLIFRSNRKCC